MDSSPLRPPRSTNQITSKVHNGELPILRLPPVGHSHLARSPDGTCLIANSEDQHLKTFVLPVDLLESPSAHQLKPYADYDSPEPIYTTAVYPYYQLSDPSTTLVLFSTRDLPIRLSNALVPDSFSSYPLVSPTTEQYITPHALAFCRSGALFLTGSDSQIAVFDLSRPNQGPIESFRTIPSKHKKIVGGGVGIKGIVSALNISVEGILAAGTLSRNIGLYADEGRGDTIALFPLSSDKELRGVGVTQVLWSPCGRYLYVAERKSDGVLIYDVRVTGRRMGWLKRRQAQTNQRMGVEIVPTSTGNEVWAGGTDGTVRAWQNSWQREGEQEPFFEFVAHTDAVPSSAFHPMGTVMATICGQRHSPLQIDRDLTPSGASRDSPQQTLSPPPTSAAEKPSNDTLCVWSFE